jgi:hypothetical protein
LTDHAIPGERETLPEKNRRKTSKAHRFSAESLALLSDRREVTGDYLVQASE